MVVQNIARLLLPAALQPVGRGGTSTRENRCPYTMAAANEEGGCRRLVSAQDFCRSQRLGEQRGVLARWQAGADRLYGWDGAAVGDGQWEAGGHLGESQRLGVQCSVLARWQVGADRLGR